MIRHIPQSFRTRVQQSRSAKEIYALVTEAPATELQDPLTVSMLYSQFGKFHRHAPLPQEKTNVVLSKLAELEQKFPTYTSLVHSVYAMSLLETKAFPKLWQTQLEEMDLSKLILPDLCKLAESYAVLQRRQQQEEMDKLCDELLQRGETIISKAPATQLVILLWSLANTMQHTAKVKQASLMVFNSLLQDGKEIKKPQLIADLLCSAGKLGFGRNSNTFSLDLLALSKPMVTDAKSTLYVANWALGLSYFADAGSKEFALVSEAMKQRKLNEFALVDLLKVYLAMLRKKQLLEDEFLSRFFQLLRNRKVVVTDVGLNDVEFGFPQALEVLHMMDKNATTPFQLYEHLSILMQSNLKLATPTDLADMLECFRRVGYRNTSLFDALLVEFSQHRKLKSFTVPELCKIVHTVAWFDYHSRAGDVVDAVSDCLVEGELTFTNWLKLAWSLQSMDHRNAKRLLKAKMGGVDQCQNEEERMMFAQLFPSTVDVQVEVQDKSDMFTKVHDMVKKRYPSTQSDLAVSNLQVDMFVPELNLAITVDDKKHLLDCKQEVRLGPARFHRKLLKQHGYRVLNVNHFMLQQENLDKFFDSLSTQQPEDKEK